MKMNKICHFFNFFLFLWLHPFRVCKGQLCFLPSVSHHTSQGLLGEEAQRQKVLYGGRPLLQSCSAVWLFHFLYSTRPLLAGSYFLVFLLLVLPHHLLLREE